MTMIILSNSIPKTGSTILASYQEDMIEVSKRTSGQEVLRSRFGGRYIPRPSNSVLANLVKTDLLHGSLVVKCHWPFTTRLDIFCRLFNVRMTFSYRDPRDMILSMIDHGERSRNGQDPAGSFSDCLTIRDLIPRTVGMMESLKMWKKNKYVLPIRYEDLMSNPVDILEDINSFLGLSIERDALNDIFVQRNKDRASSHNFNKGTTERWKTEMNEDEKDECRESFKPYLIGLGYELK